MNHTQPFGSFDYNQIIKMIEPNSRVLDLGCGNGELLLRLAKEKNVSGTGVDKEESMILQCIQRGISVFQGDLDEGLKDYPDGSYDYVILNRTLQMVSQPVFLLQEMVRVGKKVIVNFPNFGYIVNRLQLTFLGKMPVNKRIPFQWYDTPNIHFCTRRDFTRLCHELKIPVLRKIDLQNGRKMISFMPNLFASEVCMMLKGRCS
ncbi:MAG: methionine biosynthesis protein MetW [Spirochaetaceae bacterium]|nr:MAG: methionine biosynthesis protein MetW [Spirochaetaceae bacterium]